MAKTHEHIENNPEGEYREVGKPVYTAEGVLKDRLEPGSQDMFFVSEEAQRRYGIEPSLYDYGWARNPQDWKKVEGGDRIEEIRYHAPGTEVIRNDEYDLVTRGDLVLIKIPKAYGEASRMVDERNRKEYEAQFEEVPGEEDALESHKQIFDRSNTQALERSARQEHRRNVESGLIGPTKGLSLREGLEYELRTLMREGYTREEAQGRVRQQMEEFRNIGKHKDVTDEDWARIVGGPQAARAERARGATIRGADIGDVRTTRERVRANLGKDKK